VASSLLFVSATATTVNVNSLLLHGAEKGLWYDLVHLPEFWPAGIALVVFLVLVRIKRRQERTYSARPVMSRSVAGHTARPVGDLSRPVSASTARSGLTRLVDRSSAMTTSARTSTADSR